MCRASHLLLLPVWTKTLKVWWFPASWLNELEKYSGCIIDTSGILDQSVGPDVIRDIVAEFSVSVIVVLGHERLYNDMVRRFGDRSRMAVVKLARSGGAVEVNDNYLEQLQNHITKKYFYGEMKNILSPVSRTLDFKTIKVFRLAQGESDQAFQMLTIEQQVQPCTLPPCR